MKKNKSLENFFQKKLEFIFNLPQEQLKLILNGIKLLHTKSVKNRVKILNDFPTEQFVKIMAKVIAYFINENDLDEEFCGSTLKNLIKELVKKDTVDETTIENLILNYAQKGRSPLEQKLRTIHFVSGILNEIKFAFTFYLSTQEMLFQKLSKQKFLVVNHNSFKLQ
ncbi:MAG: hypothetical protein RMI30_01285 [Thermodesulfovibrio sp.]|nr:hypothetical protein [Thermodesulfovibrio sp.]MDW7998078.1 hypothetical protein [Thermodesulfovibrio sp.]